LLVKVHWSIVSSNGAPVELTEIAPPSNTDSFSTSDTFVSTRVVPSPCASMAPPTSASLSDNAASNRLQVVPAATPRRAIAPPASARFAENVPSPVSVIGPSA
jgi:hypothetical protein